jgi:hypothetical protein
MVTNSTPRISREQAALTASQRLVLQSLVPIAIKAATAQLEEFTTRLIEALLILAEQTVRPNESVICLHAYNHLKKNPALFNRAVSNRLSELLLQEVNAIGAATSLPSLDDDEDFSLVSMEEMEDKVLIGNLSQAIAHDHSSLLNALNIRISNVMQRDEISLEKNPFRPGIFVQAAYDAWCQFDPSAESHHVVVRLFRPDVFLQIDPILKDLNDALIARGIVPSLKAAYRGKKQSGEAQQQSTNESDTLRGKLQNLLTKSQPQDQALAQQIQPQQIQPQQIQPQQIQPQQTQHQQILPQQIQPQATRYAGQQSAQAVADANASIAAFVAGSALFGYLSELQKQSNGQAVGNTSQVAPQSAETLRQIKKQAPQGTLTVVDENTIELLAKVFDYVFGEQTVADDIKCLIGQLQIPLLKAALIDKEFFFKDDHPARNLIESLAKSSLAWNQEKGHDDPLYKKIERIVERVQTDFDQQLEFFNEMVADLDSFIKEERKLSSRELAAPIAQAMRQERMAQAQKKAERDIALRIETGEVAGFVERFLEDQWTQVLTLAHSVHETKPQALLHAVKAMDLLIWSVKPKTSPDERKKLINRLPALLSLVNAWLNAVKWDGAERVKFFSQLAERHAGIVKMPIELSPRHQFETAVTIAQRASEHRFNVREKEMRAQPVDQFVHIVNGMTVDDWVQFTRSNEKKVKYCLSWVSPKRSRYVFSNRQGDAPLVFSADELAQSLRGGHTTILPLTPIVGRALNVVLDEAHA